MDAGIPIFWFQGPFANATFEHLVEWDHWHTGFYIRSRLIHIDFISFFHMGPQTTYREFRVFNDNQEIRRGGG